MNRGNPTPDAPGAPGASTGTPDTSASGRARSGPLRQVLGLAILLFLGLLATAGVKSYRDLGTAQDREQELLREITDANERIRALDRRLDGILNDPVVLERLAREDLGLVRAGDVVIVLPEEPPEPEPLRPAADSSSP